MAATEFVFLYTTFPDMLAAERVAEALIEKRLCACVNIYPPMTSLYRWDGRLERTKEVATFIKTRRALIDDVIAAGTPLHPYSVPCFLVLPVEAGNEDYLAWARDQTAGL